MIFGPMLQVGWARASSMVTPCEVGPAPAPERPPGGGEHHGGDSLGVVVGPQAHVDGAVLGVDRYQLGTRGGRARLHDGAGGDEGLLVGERQPLAGLERAEGHRQAGEADHAVDAHVGGRADGGERVRPGHHLGAGRQAVLELRGRGCRRRWRRPWAAPRRPGRPGRRPSEWAPMATTSNRSGSAATTSSVCVPIEPVDPAMETVVVTPRRLRGSGGRAPGRGSGGHPGDAPQAAPPPRTPWVRATRGPSGSASEATPRHHKKKSASLATK